MARSPAIVRLKNRLARSFFKNFPMNCPAIAHAIVLPKVLMVKIPSMWKRLMPLKKNSCTRDSYIDIKTKMISVCQAHHLPSVRFGLSIACIKLEKKKKQRNCLTNCFRTATTWACLAKTSTLTLSGCWATSRKPIHTWRLLTMRWILIKGLQVSFQVRL